MTQAFQPLVAAFVSGSPSAQSRSSCLLEHCAALLSSHLRTDHRIAVRDLPAAALFSADVDDPSIAQAVAWVHQADVVVISTPIYKAAYSGVLKTFLDLLPSDALRDKMVLPLASGGSPAHMLAVDFTLRPVLAALGARHVLDSVYASDAQLVRTQGGGFLIDEAVTQRMRRAVAPLVRPMPASLATDDRARCSA